MKNMKKVQNIYDNKDFFDAYKETIYEELKNGKFYPQGLRIKIVRFPKVREIQVPTIRDKIVQHFICDNYLTEVLEKPLIKETSACITGRGTRYAINIIKEQLLVNNPDNEDYNVINSKAINANTYSVYLSLKDISNYMWEDGTTGNKVLNCTLNKKKASITARSSTIEYDGYSHTYGGDSVCSVSGIVDGASASLNCGSVTKTGLGVYTITAGGSISNNYDIQYVNGTFTIRDTTKPYCGINSDENGTLTISCGDTSGDIALCGWNSSGSGYTANMTVSRSGTYYGYVRDGAGNTNSCSKTVSATTMYRKATCASVSCSSYTGYGTPSVSNVKTCSSSGSYGISSSYTTCESTTLYYGTCKSYCCYGTKSNCSYTSAYNAGTGYYTDAYSAKNAASCSSSCSRTNLVYSDWATTEIDANIKSMWYRFSRREDDYCIECSEDGVKYKQMRICHMYKATDEIQFGIYACSPEDSSFVAKFSNMEIRECEWLAHSGQKPDEI